MYQKKIINKLKKKKILVLGDFFLDEYLYGTSDRLSPEAPAPVINYKSSNYNLGGAGNVIANLSNLFVNVIPIGFIGKDVVSKKILKIIKSKKNIKLDGLIADASFEAIKKTRLMIERTQIARLDYEKINHNLSDKHFSKIKLKIDKNIKNVDLVLISDYGKGFLNSKIIRYVITRSKKLKIKSLIDPRKKINVYSSYSKVNYITPNLNELRNIFPNLLDESKYIFNACKIISKKHNLKKILVTRGSKGITYFDGKNCKDYKSEAKQVFDVSGAGDTVISVFSVCLMLGLSEVESIKIANMCAGYVVSLKGTEPIIFDKFYEYIKKNPNHLI
jgi:D-beta-D-heptose 7-phosphate kinase/D-beta-D-heptose 1-phosphate adenosyltransferase